MIFLYNFLAFLVYWIYHTSFPIVGYVFLPSISVLFYYSLSYCRSSVSPYASAKIPSIPADFFFFNIFVAIFPLLSGPPLLLHHYFSYPLSSPFFVCSLFLTSLFYFSFPSNSSIKYFSYIPLSMLFIIIILSLASSSIYIFPYFFFILQIS